jgi:hypothetical protein
MRIITQGHAFSYKRGSCQWLGDVELISDIKSYIILKVTGAILF